MGQVVFQEPEIVVEVEMIPHVHPLNLAPRNGKPDIGNRPVEMADQWNVIDPSEEKKE